MPKELKPGVLYVSEEFGTAAHLCPCGCGCKIRTSLGPTEWSLIVSGSRPTLFPSVGNWQIPCQSHYWITDGKIVWARQWTEEEVAAGRRNEEDQRYAYYEALNRKRHGILNKLWDWLKALFK